MKLGLLNKLFQLRYGKVLPFAKRITFFNLYDLAFEILTNVMPEFEAKMGL